MYGTATDEAVDAMHDDPTTDEAKAPKRPSMAEHKNEQRKQAEARRQETLKRLRWAKGRGLDVHEIARRMNREHNPVLRDLRDLEARGDVHENAGLWYVGMGTEPGGARIMPASRPRPPLDIPAVVLEVLGDRQMFAGELTSAVEVRLPEVGRAAIAVHVARMREAGELDDDGLLLQRLGLRPELVEAQPIDLDQTAAVEARDTGDAGASTDRQGAGAPADVTPRPAPAPVEQAGAAPASVGAPSPVEGDLQSPLDSRATGERELVAPSYDDVETIDFLDPAADEMPAAVSSSHPAPPAPLQDGEDHAERERSASAQAGATDRDRQGTDAPQPAAPQRAQPSPAEEAVAVEGSREGADPGEVGHPVAPADEPEIPERAPLRDRLWALVHAEHGLSLTEAAARLGCHATRVSQLAHELELRRVKRGNKRALYPPMTKRNGVHVDVQGAVLDFVRCNPGCSVHEVAGHIEATPEWARQVMRTVGCTNQSTNKVSRWFPPADSEPSIAVPCPDDDDPLSQSEQPRPGAGDVAGGDAPSQSVAEPIDHNPPPQGGDVDPPSLGPPEADGSVVEFEALRLALGLDDGSWTAADLLDEVTGLVEDCTRYDRALDRGGIPPSPDGEDLGWRIGVLEERLRGVACA